MPAAHLDTLLGTATPNKHLLQCLWQLACTGRRWVDLVSYSRDFPAAMQLVVRRIERDDHCIIDLQERVRVFLRETDTKLAALMTAYAPQKTFAAVRRLKKASGARA